MDNENYFKQLQTSTSEYRRLLKIELEERWNSLTIDQTKTAEYEVIFALLSRQCSFVYDLSFSPFSWNEVFLPVIMRCMVENYINISYITQNPIERAKLFIKKGLSSESLILQKIKIKGELSLSDKEFIESTENWINQQSFIYLNEINVGDWKETKEFSDVRDTAIKSAEKEYYDLFYDVCSSATHSSWNYISKHNMTICENPLHKNHRIPIIIEPTIEPSMILILARILNDTFNKIDTYYKLNICCKSSYDFFLNDLQLNLKN